VISLFLFQGRSDFAADSLGFPAAWVKTASTGRLDRTGNITFEDDAFALSLNGRIRYWNG
jgi:hypothetical protein